MKKRIVFVNGKGGVTKTTTSTLCAATLCGAGLNAAIEDRDSQGSATFLANEVLGIPLSHEGEEGYDYVIVDSKGNLDLVKEEVDREYLKEITQEADRVVLITKKDPLSVNVSKVTAGFVKTWLKPESDALVLFSAVRKNTIIGDQDPIALAKQIGLPLIPQQISALACYEKAQVAGLKALTADAEEELLKLSLNLIS